MEKQWIIYDTDMDTDCDDAGALGIVLSRVKAGKAGLLGIVADAPVPHAAPCCEAICRWYGVECLIGAARADRYSADPRFDAYRGHRSRLPKGCYYNEALADSVGKTDRDYLPAGLAYRKMLAGAEDGSVTIVCVGLMTALAELLESPADDISPLNGVELCRKKVKCVVSMSTAPYPRYDQPNFNYMMDAAGAHTALEKCPAPIYVSPEGTEVITGHSFARTLPPEHPLRRAYMQFAGSLFGNENAGRSSWDLIAALYALEPENPMFRLEEHGTVHYDQDGLAWWDDEGSRRDGQIHLAVPNAVMAARLETLMTENIG